MRAPRPETTRIAACTLEGFALELALPLRGRQPLTGTIVPTFQRVRTPFSYSTAVVAGDTAYLGLHRGFGGTLAAQVRGTFEALTGTLDEIGLTAANLVKVTVWLKDIADLPEMEHLFREFFPDGEFPARMTATTEFVDADCLLMIEGIACRERSDLA